MAATLRDNFSGSASTFDMPNGTVDNEGQSFTPTEEYVCEQIRFYATWGHSDPGTCRVSIQETTAGLPNGSLLTDWADFSVAGAQDKTYRTVDFTTQPTLSIGTKYAVVWDAPSGDPGVAELIVWGSAPSGYSGGNRVYNTGSWNDSVTQDMNFAIWGSDATPSKPINPTPADSDTQVDFSARTLSWTDGGGAATFDVYIGPVGNLSLISSAQAGTSKVVDTGDVPWGETISWRVDATNGSGTTTGDTWSFDTVVVRSAKLGSGGSFILVTAKDGVYTSTDFGVNWTRRLPDAVGSTDWTKGICSSTGTYIVAVSSANAIYRSVNGGAAWGEVTPAGGDTFSVSDMATSDDGQYMVIVGTNSTDPTESCYISTDYGATWTAKKPVSASIAWGECDISNDGSVIVVSLSDYIYVSFDSGTTWLDQGMAASGTDWACFSVSGDGNYGLVCNTSVVNDFFVGVRTTLYSEATWAESDLTSAGRALLDDATAAAQATTLGLGVGDSPEFTGVTLSGVTASRLVWTDGSKALASKNLVDLVAGTANRVTVADDSAGGITLSAPQDIHTGASPTFSDLTLTTPSNIYALSHDSFADFAANEHFLQTAITNVSTALSTGLLKVTTGTGALSVVADNSANWDTAYTHSQLTSGNPHQVSASDVGLGSVENTALSTWAGTTSITTLGTITTGTWNGTTIAIANGGTGQTTAQAAIDALTAVSGATDEHVLTKDTATGNATWKAATGSGSALTSSAKAYLGTNQALTTSTWTKIQLDTEVWDNDSDFDSTTNYRFVAPADGVYLVTAKITFLGMSAGDAQACGLYVGGVQEIYNYFYTPVALNIHTFISYTIKLTASQYLELWGWHNHGTNRNVSQASSITYMVVTRIQ